MGALLSLPTTLLNLLLPFTSKSTPLLQDVLHTAILCVTLYFAPQLAELYASRKNPPHSAANPDTPRDDNIPLDERLIHQPSSSEDEDEDNPDPRPGAPTPPPDRAVNIRFIRNEAGEVTHIEETNNFGEIIHRPFVPLDINDDQGDDEDGFRHPRRNHNNQNQNHQEGGRQGQGQEARQAQAQGHQEGGRQGHDGPRATPQNRAIGAKKAKSLARKDQRRAYHEFHRQEAELRRIQEAEGAAERNATLAAEKERRQEAERLIQERNRQERLAKKELEEKEALEERMRREKAVRIVKEKLEREGVVNLVDVAWEHGKDLLWIERLVRASGGLKEEEGVYTMITDKGWAVRLDTQIMRQVYKEAVEFGNAMGGKVGFGDFGGILEEAVRVRAGG